MEQQLSAYKVFYTVASTGNISNAAKELYISQPAISKTIQKLEQNLGVTLFYRKSRGVQLTLEGKILFEHVKSAFETLQTGERQIKRSVKLGVGQLHIGVSTTLCKYVLLPYLQKFIEQYPHIQITIETQSSNQTIELLENNKIDIGLVGYNNFNKHLNYITLGEIEDIFVTTSGYLKTLQEREIIGSSLNNSTDFFQDSTLILLDQNNVTRQYINEYFFKNHISTNNILEVSNMDLLIEFANIGLGIACVIKDFVKEELKTEHLIELPLKLPIPKRNIGFAFSKKEHSSPSLEKFINFIQNSNF